MSQSRLLKHIVVLGATGNIGRPIIDSLLAHPAGYTVTAVTRNPAKAAFPAAVKVVESDFSNASLGSIFRNQDVVISTVPGPQITEQRRFVDVAISCNVARFIPSEFGMDTSKTEAVKWRPGLAEKVKVIDYLKSKESELSWTAFITGAFFDWSFKIPGALGFNLPERAVTIFDGGNTELEATNVKRIGDAVAASLAPEYKDVAANQYAYINSFTTTQNEIKAIVEKVIGKKLTVTQDTTTALRARSAERLRNDPSDSAAGLAMITASILGLGGINEYSKEHELWNNKLGLKHEDLEEAIRAIIPVSREKAEL